MDKSCLGILVMAAGKGTRMKSGVHDDLPKVLFPILDKPMLGYLLKTVRGYAAECGQPVEIAVLVGNSGEQVCEYLQPFPDVEILWQKEQLGTGHAVQVSRSWWERFQNVLVLNGDLPLLTSDTLRSFLKEHLQTKAACSLLSFDTERPDGYGRVIRGPREEVSIVEHKDASPEQRLVKEVNAGCYVFDAEALRQVIDGLKNDNSQKEYYLPDVVASMNVKGMKVRASLADEREMQGVNTQSELAAVTALVRGDIVQKWMERGVRIMDPFAVWLGPDVQLSPGVCLMPGVQIWGDSVVGEGCTIGPYCILRNAVLGRKVNLIANVVVEDSELRDNSKAGPFAYIRESSLLNERAFAGKFVELKKTVVGKGSKVPHLSYMGDATLGEDVNIGAGSVTCNYDGKNKFPTKIGDRCFVGSDTMMVAPVTLGEDSMTAAGSTITADVPSGAMGIARARQKNLEGWARRKKQIQDSRD